MTRTRTSSLSLALLCGGSLLQEATSFACGTAGASSTTQRANAVQLQATKQATFGMGCFWEPSEELLKVDGVLETVAGYTGNPDATSAPSYQNVCYGRQWVEGVRVVYDDDKLSFEDLLQEFFRTQKPEIGSRQYASVIFPHDDDQESSARAWIQQNKDLSRPDGWTPQMTSVEQRTRFFQAEGYHQRFWQKQRPRFLAIIGLLAIATGILDPIVPEQYQSTVAAAGNNASLVALLAMLAERKLDAKVVELE